MQAPGEPSRAAARIGEDEHPDRARLPVPDGLEGEGLGRASLAAYGVEHGWKDRSKLVTEERKRDVEFMEPSPAGEVGGTPLRERPGDVCRHLECEKEPEPLIPLDGTRPTHPDVSRLSNNLRTR